MMVTGSKMAPGYHMKNAWLVALIFTMQAVLLGAAPICDCVEPTQAPPADGCCTDEATPAAAPVTARRALRTRDRSDLADRATARRTPPTLRDRRSPTPARLFWS